MIFSVSNFAPEVWFSLKNNFVRLQKGPRSYCVNISFAYPLPEAQGSHDEISLLQNDHFLFFWGSDFKIFWSRNATQSLHKTRKNSISWQEIKIFKSFLIFTLVLEKYLEQNVSKMALLVNYQQHVHDKY